jgi:hypothetical protein
MERDLGPGVTGGNPSGAEVSATGVVRRLDLGAVPAELREHANEQGRLHHLCTLTRVELVRAPLEPAALVSSSSSVLRPAPGDARSIAEQWRTFAGFAIEIQPVATPTVGELVRQLHVIGYLLALPTRMEWAVQLRVTAVPDSTRLDASRIEPQLTLHLVCAASAPTARMAEDYAREVAAAVELAGRFLAPTYELRPIRNIATLEKVLDPFSFLDVVEIQRRELTLPAASGTLLAPVALPAFGGFGQWLCDALVGEATRRGRPLGWFVTMEGVEVGSAARSTLLAAERSALTYLVDERAPATGETAISVFADRMAAPVEFAAPVLAGHRQTLAGLIGRVQAFLAADELLGVPPAVVAAAISECSDAGCAAPDGSTAPARAERALRTTELEQARRALNELRCYVWREAERDASGPEHAGDATAVSGTAAATTEDTYRAGSRMSPRWSGCWIISSAGSPTTRTSAWP